MVDTDSDGQCLWIQEGWDGLDEIRQPPFWVFRMMYGEVPEDYFDKIEFPVYHWATWVQTTDLQVERTPLNWTLV